LKNKKIRNFLKKEKKEVFNHDWCAFAILNTSAGSPIALHSISSTS
jgi:hypothetical protein